MTTITREAGSLIVDFDDKGTGRKCGDCTLCCKLIPVETIRKPAGHKCQHQSFKGCKIYTRRPLDCRVWSCAWLSEKSAAELRRPDRSHYVIDVMTDTLYVDREPVEALQVWVDPAYPDAHTDPPLRRFIDAQKMPAIIRYSASKALAIFPPSITEDHQWHDKVSSLDTVSPSNWKRLQAMGLAIPP